MNEMDKTNDLYFDEIRLKGVTEMKEERIKELSKEYLQYLERDDLMPRARESAQRILSRLAFEMICREGYYGYVERLPE